MISTRQRKAVKALALFLVFTMAQVYIEVNFAGTSAEAKDATTLPAQGGGQLTGKLTTTGGQPIIVNGTSLASGGTLLSGATIEVPDGVGATIDLGPLGQLDLAPNTSVVLEFSDGQVRVKVVRGCAILRTKKGTEGQVSTDQGVAATNDSKKDDVADVCFPPGAPGPIVNQGAAAGAGAGAGGGGGGIGAGTIALIGGGIAGGTALALALNDGDNPSPSTP